MSIILTVIGSYIVVCGLSFLWNLILTPPAMEREKDKEHAAFAEAALDREPILESPEMRLTRREVAGIMPQLTAAEIGLIREMAMGRGLTEIDATIRSGGSAHKMILMGLSNKTNLLRISGPGKYEIIPSFLPAVQEWLTQNQIAASNASNSQV